MVIRRSSSPYSTAGGFRGGLTGHVPRDLWILAGVVLLTFSLQFFASTAIVPALLRLTPAVWREGFVWQLVTYPLVGAGTSGLWLLIELVIILFMFGRDVYSRLGQRHFWRLMLWGSVGAAVAAVLVQMAINLVSGGFAPRPFVLMQGQHMLLVVMIVAFSILNSHATILFMFVLPIEARWFVLITVVGGFLGFLSTRDLAGFAGICTAVAVTYGYLSPSRARGIARESWLRLQAAWIRLRLGWLKKKRGFKVIKGGNDDPRDPWVH